ncbi:MAG: hypothetical protein Q8N85_03040 [Candidatus Omnitrophota bacterium]|nr:hypothetical protein [Candidatus Omnitrophota bacterium]
MRPPLRRQSLTLIELLIAVILLSVIVLAFSNIQIFGHFQVLTGDRRAKVQNEAARVIAHMSKEISRAIGNEALNNVKVIDTQDITNDGETKRIKIYVDGNSNGKSEYPADDTDYWIAYRFYDSGNPKNKNQVQFCGKCKQKNCNTCDPPNWKWEVLSSNITDFTCEASSPLTENFINAQVAACWDPRETSYPCGDRENPSVTLQSRIQMPSVSTH